MKHAKITIFFSWVIAVSLAILVALTPAKMTAASPMILVNGNQSLRLALFPNQQEKATVTLVNRFEVTQDDITAFLDRWSKIGEYMKQQPGFVAAELKKDILSSKDWIMSEKWSSLDAYKRAIASQEFQALIKDFPAKASWFAPELFPSS